MAGRIYNNIIEVRQGDSFDLALRFNKDCEVLDLTGSVVKMQVRGIDDNLLKFEVTSTIIAAKVGTCLLRITPEQTNMPVGDYYTDIQITLANGAVHTVFPADVQKVGVFKITKQITQ